MTTNQAIWDDIYSQGRMLWYPYEVAVRVIHGLRGRGLLDGVVLDHGCGSGNHLEFMTRLGVSCIGTEVAPGSVDLIRQRFAGAKLPEPPVTLFDPDQPLGPQLPAYDHVFAWGSVHYNRRAKVLEDLQSLAEGIQPGGRMVAAVPTGNDIVARHSTPQGDGSTLISADISGQQGAIVTIPADQDDFVSWFPSIEVDDCGTFGWTIEGRTSEYFFLSGARRR